jgi:hypothetical protein
MITYMLIVCMLNIEAMPSRKNDMKPLKSDNRCQATIDVKQIFKNRFQDAGQEPLDNCPEEMIGVNPFVLKLLEIYIKIQNIRKS